MEAVNLSRTTFEIVSGTSALPLTVGLTLESRVKAWLDKKISRGQYSERRIKIQGMSLHFRTIDLSRNERLLNEIQDSLRGWQTQSAADFLLQWAESDGIVVTQRKQMLGLIGIIQTLCQLEVEILRMPESKNDRELVPAFRNISDDFMVLMG
jgi:hypothetical protein